MRSQDDTVIVSSTVSHVVSILFCRSQPRSCALGVADHNDYSNEWSDEENIFADPSAALVLKANVTKIKAKRKRHTKAATKRK